MIWVVVIVGLAGIATTPYMFAGMWARKWFRVCCYIAIWFLLGIAYQSWHHN
jgi:hypothetical protein